MNIYWVSTHSHFYKIRLEKFLLFNRKVKYVEQKLLKIIIIGNKAKGNFKKKYRIYFHYIFFFNLGDKEENLGGKGIIPNLGGKEIFK